MNIMPKFFIEDSSNLKHPKNVKSVNNITSYYLVSCRVIFRPDTMKEWKKMCSEKYVLLESKIQ